MDSSIETWKIRQEDPAFQLKEHLNSVQSVSINPININQVISGSHDHSIKIWDINKKICTNTISEHFKGVWTVSHSPDGNLFASGSVDSQVMLWDLRDLKKCIRKFQTHSSYVQCVKFDQNNEKLFGSCGDDQQIIFYDVSKNEPIKKISVDCDINYQISFSNDGNYFGVCDYNQKFKLFDYKTFNLISEYQVRDENNAKNKCFSAIFQNPTQEKQKISIGYSDGNIRQLSYDKSQNKLFLKNTVFAHLNEVKSLAYEPKSGHLLSTCKDGGSRIFNSQDYSFIATLTGHTDNASCSDMKKLNNEQNLIVTGGWDQAINIYYI